MANVPGTFYTAETQRKGATPVSPPNANDDPQGPIGGATVPPVAKRYTSQAIMIADQNNQLEGYLYFDGTDNWWYNGGTSGTIADYVAFGGGSGATDTDAVHYSTADGKNATEKQQARDNIGLDTGISQSVTTDADVSDLSRTNNLIIFTGATISRNFTGMSAGVDGERVLIWNRRSFNIILSNNITSTVGNRFILGDNYTILPNQKVGLLYSTAQNGWVFDQAGLDQFVNKKIADFKEYPLDIWTNGRANTNRLTITQPGGRTAIFGTRNGSYIPRILFDNNVFYMGNDKGSAAVWGIHIESTDLIHLARQSNGATSAIATGYSIKSWLGHYFEDDVSTLGLTIRVLTVTTAGAINDLAIGVSSNIRLTSATDVTGMSAANIGKRVIIQNHNSVNVNILHDSASSIAANRFDLIGAVTLVIPPKGKSEFIYCTGARWELLNKNF